MKQAAIFPESSSAFVRRNIGSVGILRINQTAFPESRAAWT